MYEPWCPTKVSMPNYSRHATQLLSILRVCGTGPRARRKWGKRKGVRQHSVHSRQRSEMGMRTSPRQESGPIFGGVKSPARVVSIVAGFPAPRQRIGLSNADENDGGTHDKWITFVKVAVRYTGPQGPRCHGSKGVWRRMWLRSE